MPTRAMRRLALTALLPLAATGHGAEPTPLQPAGRWVVDYQESMCVLQRAYGSAQDLTTLAFRPTPTHGQTEVALLTARGPSLAVDSRATLSIDGHEHDADLQARTMPKTRQRITTMIVHADIMNEVGAASTISAPMPGRGRRTFALTGAAAAVKALRTCENDLLKSWGVDLATLDRAAKPAVLAGDADPSTWFGPDDYPPEVQRANLSGRVLTRVAIGPDGHVADCAVVETSRVPTLDQRTCEIVMRRAHYDPALDKDGKPVATWSILAVRWQLR